jgi:hypothetical protein
MARHARREGELVLEGTLAADKALLWNAIKDKPKVQCSSCGESFTRCVPALFPVISPTGLEGAVCGYHYVACGLGADCAGWTR